MLTPEGIDCAVELFHEQLNSRLKLRQEELRKARSNSHALVREQNRQESERKNIIASLLELGPVESLKAEFNRVEGRLRIIANGLKENVAQVPLEVSLDNARQFVHDRAKQLSELLLSDRTSAQQAIRRFIGQLTISRAPAGRVPMCRVQGGVQPGEKDVMPSGTGYRTIYRTMRFAATTE
jgi:hypothetical protein